MLPKGQLYVICLLVNSGLVEVEREMKIEELYKFNLVEKCIWLKKSCQRESPFFQTLDCTSVDLYKAVKWTAKSLNMPMFSQRFGD